MRILNLIITACLLVLLTSSVQAVTINATSVSRQHVGEAYASAGSGDIIVIPAGTASWTNTLTITTPVTIQGAGVGQTIILDDIVKPPGGANSTEAILYLNTINSTNIYRISGIEFRTGLRTTSFIHGSIQLSGLSERIRVDHCKFDRLRNAGVYILGSTLGVLDNNEWNKTLNHSVATMNSGLYGKSNGYGSWETPIVPGSDQAFYIEDNILNGDDSDAFGGGRAVWRFNVFTNSLIHTHGTESTGQRRAFRWHEIYGNLLYHTNTDNREFIDFRDGNGVIASNTIINLPGASVMPSMIGLNCYRFFGPYRYWGGADGTNPLDVNDTAGGIFYTGLVTTGTVGTSGTASRTFTDATKTWAPDELRGFTVRNMSSNYSSHTSIVFPHTSNMFSVISANTGTTLTYVEHPIAPKLYFAAGNAYEIRRVIAALDSPGSGPSDPFNPADPNAQPNQGREILYQWANTNNGSPVVIAASAGIINGRDYTNNVPHPTWTPYTYPHPLRTGDTNVPPSPPSAPTGLSVIAVSSVSSARIDMTWTNTAGTNAELVRIERSLTGGGAGFAQIAIVDATESTYQDLALLPETTYYYRIRASNGNGFSSYTSEANATTLPLIVTQTPKGRRIGLFKLIAQ